MALACRMAITILAIVASVRVSAAQEPGHGQAPPPSAARPPLTDPTFLLLRDGAVRDALALTPEQSESLDALFRRHTRLLLAMRDVGPTGADETAKPALREIRAALAEILQAEQRVRLQGLVLQAQGYDSLLRKDVAAQLKLTPEQEQQLAEISAVFREQAQALQRGDKAKSSAETLEGDLARLQADRHKRIVAQLTPEQQTRYGELLGEPFNFAQVQPSPADAPEFTAIEEWFNTEPLTMQALRGRVVVIHFFAFGCSNCINNYPWYREWQEAFQGKDVTIIGIHTPETSTEENNDLLRASLDEHKLKFPVAVDKQKKMWQAWYNRMWPSVYLVDKQGRVRYWWYGELDWQGAGGQKLARQRIEQMLAEE
ncbi:MAG TPA: redoxin domain-containing protein [Lacipirellula sp.]